MRRFSIVIAVVVLGAAGAVARTDGDSGWVRVLTTPSGASVYVDGRLAGQSPVDSLALEAGRHVVQFQRHGPYRWTVESVADSFDVRSGELTSLDVVIPGVGTESGRVVVFDQSHVLSGPGDLGVKSEVWTLTAGGAMVVSGILAAVFRDRANAAAADYLRTGDPDALSDVRTYDRLAGASMVGVQLSLGAFVLFLTTP